MLLSIKSKLWPGGEVVKKSAQDVMPERVANSAFRALLTPVIAWERLGSEAITYTVKPGPSSSITHRLPVSTAQQKWVPK